MNLTPRRRRALEYIVAKGGDVSAQEFYDVLDGDSRSIRALLATKLVITDSIPAQTVAITTAGRDALG